MAFWDREKDLRPSENNIPLWEEAKLLSPEVATQPEILAPGWYFYKENYLWHGLKPNDNGEGFQKGFDFQSLRDLQQWLGIPIPKDLIAQEETKETLTEQLERLQRKPVSNTNNKKPTTKSAAPIRGRRRNIDIHIKVSPKECEEIKARVAESGMSMTTYLLRCALQPDAQVPPLEEASLQDMQALLDLLSALLAEVGRQGGMLKMVIKPNEGQRSLHSEEWDALIKATQDQGRIKKKIENVMDSINGYFKTHNI